MKVKDICSRQVFSCSPEMNLSSVVSMMWDFDLGSVPVVDPDGRIVGMITDRDIAIALGTRNRRAPDVRAGDVMSKQVHACAPDDDLRSAMNTMWTEKIRRLPVVGAQGRVVGILSISDLILRAQVGGDPESGPGWEDVLLTLKGICSPRRPRAREARPATAYRA